MDGHFVGAVLSGQTPTIHGDPARAYDFIHIADVVTTIANILSADLTPGVILNVGSGQPTRLDELARWCLAAGGSALAPTLAPGPAYRPPQFADLSRIRSVLDFAPAHDLKSWVFDIIQQRQGRR